MHLHQLKYFVSVVETGSVTKAAQRCFVSQPSISQQLHKLEDSVGRSLFKRAKGRLILTDVGHVMYEQAQKILNDVEEAKHRISDLGNSSGGSVAIGVLPTLAPFMLPAALLALAEKYPDAMVTVRENVSENLVEAAARGELDILLEVLTFDETHLTYEPLFSDEFFVVVHRDHPFAELDKVPVEALDGTTFILLEDVHCLARQIEQYCFSKRFMPKVMFQASQLATVKQLVELQYGISILPWICIDHSSDVNLRYIELDGETPSRDVVLATVRDRYLGPAAEYFLKVVKDQYQNAQHAA